MSKIKDKLDNYHILLANIMADSLNKELKKMKRAGIELAKEPSLKNFLAIAPLINKRFKQLREIARIDDSIFHN